jgi:hypothetical protein
VLDELLVGILEDLLEDFLSIFGKFFGEVRSAAQGFPKT